MLKKGNKIAKSELQKILVIQLGDIGDVVWTTPNLNAIKQTLPSADLYLLTREGMADLLKDEKSIKKIFEVHRHAYNKIKDLLLQIELIRTLRNENFDIAIDLRSDDRGAIMSYLSGAKYRASWYYETSVPFWRNYLFTHLSYSSHENGRVINAADQSHRILSDFHIEMKERIPKIFIAHKVKEIMLARLREHDISMATAVTLNPFSKKYFREWSYDKWVEIINWLWDTYHISTILVGSIIEREKSEYIAAQCKGKLINMTGRTTLYELAALLSLSELHIGMNSAPPIIAVAVGTPTITIFGPNPPSHWIPQDEMHIVITPELECAPCGKAGCNHTGISKCLKTLKVSRVREIIRFVIEKRRGSNCSKKPDFN